METEIKVNHSRLVEMLAQIAPEANYKDLPSSYTEEEKQVWFMRLVYASTSFLI